MSADDRPAGTPEITLVRRRAGRNGTFAVTAMFGDESLYTDAFEVAKAEDRDRFLDRICKDRSGIDKGRRSPSSGPLVSASSRDRAG
jgi:hypothetical protein